MIEEEQVRQKYTSFIEFLRVLIRDLEKDHQHLESLNLKLPTWKQAKDQELLYTRMYEFSHEIELINRRFAAISMARATYKKLHFNSAKIDFNWKLAVVKTADNLFEILADVEKAVSFYRDSLEKKYRQLTAAQFMQSNERFVQVPSTANGSDTGKKD